MDDLIFDFIGDFVVDFVAYFIGELLLTDSSLNTSSKIHAATPSASSKIEHLIPELPSRIPEPFRSPPPSSTSSIAYLSRYSCLSKNNETVNHNGVKIVGNSDLAALVPSDASSLFSRNILNFLNHLTDKEGQFKFDMEDKITASSLIVKDGAIC